MSKALERNFVDPDLALHGRDMPLLENILARKQSLVVLLDQGGQRRSALLANLGLPQSREGVVAMAEQSDLGSLLIEQLDVLAALMNTVSAPLPPEINVSRDS